MVAAPLDLTHRDLLLAVTLGLLPNQGLRAQGVGQGHQGATLDEMAGKETSSPPAPEKRGDQVARRLGGAGAPLLEEGRPLVPLVDIGLRVLKYPRLLCQS